MALTAKGKALTAANIENQRIIRDKAATLALQAWPLLDLNDLDGSTPAWLAAMSQGLRSDFDGSKTVAQHYLADYRQAEIGTSSGYVPDPDFDTPAVLTDLTVAGPINVKYKIGQGQPAQEAYNAGVAQVVARAGQVAMHGGRSVIMGAGARDKRSEGWRRVAGAGCCAFCGMLASRGPVYRSAQRAGSGKVYHGHCRCQPELVYGEWEPTETEQGFIDAYNKAANQANAAGDSRLQQTVLWRMRRNGGFRDEWKTSNR